jgi:isopenicillin N synthase-like dioxygenase
MVYKTQLTVSSVLVFLFESSLVLVVAGPCRSSSRRLARRLDWKLGVGMTLHMDIGTRRDVEDVLHGCAASSSSSSQTGRSTTRSSWAACRKGSLTSSGLVSIATDELHEARVQAELLRACQTYGAVVLTLPRSERLSERVAACYASSSAWFAQAEEAKAPFAGSDGIGRQHGWLCYSNGTQLFEVKRWFNESEWRWPSQPREFASAATEAFELFRDVSTRALEALVAALGMDPQYVLTLLDSSHPVPDSSCATRSLADASHSAMRIWSYQPGTPPTAWHCDNSFVTLGARGSMRGLHVRLLDGRCVYPEDYLDDDSVVLYCGDTLSYLSGGRILPLMHEVACPAADRPPRLSIPFFLRARRGEVLRPALASRGLPAAAVLPELEVEDLEENEGGVRQSWAWKNTRYYTTPSALTGQAPARYGMKFET